MKKNALDRRLEELQRLRRQDDANLRGTKFMVKLYREARTFTHLREDHYRLNLSELFKMIEINARHEWGEGTIVDDFAVPDKFVIRHGKKAETV